jgi:hypothetical protein
LASADASKSHLYRETAKVLRAQAGPRSTDGH